MAADYVYRLEQPHVAGQLAKVCSRIAEEKGLIGDIRTVTIGRERSIREISVEVRDPEQAKRVATRLGEVEGVRVISYWDRALQAHEGGKLMVGPAREMRTLQDMRDVYTPGVARVCSAIADEPALAHRFTMIGRTVAICTNGTRVLGLGDIGPVASMPVMEGKAMFYRQLAGISAIPILLDADDPDAFVETVKRIAGGFGGIHLEDIRAPDCFEIEARLIEDLDIPVMHDDVHGTAVATLGAVLVACEQAGIELEDAVVGQLGLGAAGFGIANLIHEAGAEVIASDPSVERALMRGLALTNPDPEIAPKEAEAAGAAFAADGAMVNNVLGFPGIFRGALAAGSELISSGMKLAAARAIASLTHESELVPDALDPEVHAAVARAVEDAARDEGLARPERIPVGL
jgi:malate dehydrogenase (oxaloacetate-decarboxylating)